MYQIRHPTKEDIVLLALSMRPEDKEEIWKWNCGNPYKELKDSVELSNESWALLHNDIVLCIWGLRHTSFFSTKSRIWLLCSDQVEYHKRFMWKEIKKVISSWKSSHKCLFNWMDKSNTMPKRWLTKLGFTFNPPDKKGFQYFYWTN